MMTNFGVKCNYDKMAEVAPSEPRVDYPEVRFSGKHMKVLEKMLGNKLDIDDEVEATVRFKVTSISKGGYDNSVSMSIQSMDGENDGTMEEDDAEESAPDTGPKNKA